MADTKEQQRETLRGLMTTVAGAYGGSLGDEAEWAPNEIDNLIDAALTELSGNTKEATRTKTFRFPGQLLDWLEAEATHNRRSPNAELVELLRKAKATQDFLGTDDDD